MVTQFTLQKSVQNLEGSSDLGKGVYGEAQLEDDGSEIPLSIMDLISASKIRVFFEGGGMIKPLLNRFTFSNIKIVVK